MDDFNSFFWVYPLHYKNEVFAKFLDFKSYAENQFHTSLKILRTDGGSEFVNKKLDSFLASNGIIHQQSCLYTRSQNGVAERKH